MFGRKKAPTEEEKAAMQAAMAERIRERFDEFDETVIMPFQEGLLLTFSEGLDERVEQQGIVPGIIRKFYVDVCEAPWRAALPGFEDDFYEFRDMGEWMGIIETLELREYDAWFDQKFDSTSGRLLLMAASRVGGMVMSHGLTDEEWVGD